MNYPIEKLRGHIFKTRRGASYQIRHLERHVQNLGQSYLLHIAPAAVLNDEGHEMLLSGPPSPEEFLVYFAPGFQADEQFGEGETGHIHYLLWLLELRLDQNPGEHLEMNSRGQYLIEFEYLPLNSE